MGNIFPQHYIYAEGKIYDVTPFVRGKKKHPGPIGNKLIMDRLGKDCSEEYRMHSKLFKDRHPWDQFECHVPPQILTFTKMSVIDTDDDKVKKHTKILQEADKN